MTTFDTGNPLGSPDPRDLFDNAQNIDHVANSLVDELWVDRFGVARRTWRGIERKAELDIAQAASLATAEAGSYRDQAHDARNDAIAAAGAIGPIKFYDTLEQAQADVGNLHEGDLVEIIRDEDADGARTRRWFLGGALAAPISLDQLRTDLGGTAGAELVRLALGAGWPLRSVKDKFNERISVKDFGAVGNYTADDTAAIEAAMAYCSERGLDLYFPAGVYRVTKSLRKPKNVRLVGAGRPTFNITVGSDDKRYLRPGYKSSIPGSTIVWSGAQTDAITTNRNDRWASFGYMMATEYFEPSQIEGLGLVCDVDCFDAAGNLTTPATDNRALYDAGLVIDNGMHCKLHRVAVFGYFQKKKGLVVLNRNLDASNPDYNAFYDSSIYSGVALIGHQSNPNQGLSGTLFSGCEIYDATYHNRAATPANDHIDQSVFYIDGKVSSESAISGHKVVGGGIRSTCPEPLQLDHCLDFTLADVTTECTLNSAYSGQTLKYITGTANTQRVTIAGSRTAGWQLRLRALQSEIAGPLVVDEAWNGLSYLFKNGMGVAYGSADELTGDPVVQLTRASGTSVTQGWNLRQLSTDALAVRFNGSTRLEIPSTGRALLPAGVSAQTNVSTAASPALILRAADTDSGFYRPDSTNFGLSVSSAAIWQASAASIRPGVDNAQTLGTGALRYSTAYLGSNPVVSSDANLKKVRGPLSDAEIRAWGRVQPRIYQYLDAVALKGVDDARLHAGFIAQEVEAAFAAEGLDARRYALWCEDPVFEQVERRSTVRRQKTEVRAIERSEVDIIDGKPVLRRFIESVQSPVYEYMGVIDENGNPVMDGEEQVVHPVPVMEDVEITEFNTAQTGNRLSLRYEQCLVFELAYLRSLRA